MGKIIGGLNKEERILAAIQRQAQGLPNLNNTHDDIREAKKVQKTVVKYQQAKRKAVRKFNRVARQIFKQFDLKDSTRDFEVVIATKEEAAELQKEHPNWELLNTSRPNKSRIDVNAIS
jgi:hypothetical protein